MSSDQGIFSSSAEEFEIPRVDSTEGVIVSVVESRAREVCIARMTNRAELEVYIFADSHSYVETTMTLQTLAPAEVLLSDSSRGSVLARKIEAELADARNRSQNAARTVYISR